MKNHQKYYSHNCIKVYTPVELEPGDHSQYSDLNYGLDDNTVKIPAGSRNISLPHNIQIGFGNHPFSLLSVYSGGSFCSGKEIVALGWPLTSI